MSLLAKHRTKILGGTQVGIGAVLSYMPQLQSLLKPVDYSIAMIFLGVSTAIMGFVNSAITK